MLSTRNILSCDKGKLCARPIAEDDDQAWFGSGPETDRTVGVAAAEAGGGPATPPRWST
jgi:hypothetical protein